MKRVAITLLSIILTSLFSTAQEVKTELKTEKKREAFVRVKPDKKVVLIINGKKYDSEILDLIDPEKIEAIEIVKGENARELYDEESVIVITPKAIPSTDVAITSEANKKEAGKITIRGNTNINFNDSPLILIDGKESTQAELEKLSPANISSVTIIKGEEARKKFNSENGVIQVKTKKRE